MKFSAPLLLALAAAAPFTMGLKADQLDEGSVLRRAKGTGDDDYTSYSGKGKGKGKGYYTTPPPPVCVNRAEKFYLKAEDSPVFNLDYNCPDGTKCVGAVIPFKNELYLDHYFHYLAGYSIGHCILVAEHPDEHYPDDPYKAIPQYYCLFTTVLEYEDKDTKAICEGEIAFAGYGTPFGDFLITAAAGEYAGEEGSVSVTEKDTEKKIFEYKLALIDQGGDDGDVDVSKSKGSKGSKGSTGSKGSKGSKSGGH
jgi:hypothetical protein